MDGQGRTRLLFVANKKISDRRTLRWFFLRLVNYGLLLRVQLALGCIRLNPQIKCDWEFPLKKRRVFFFYSKASFFVRQCCYFFGSLLELEPMIEA